MTPLRRGAQLVVLLAFCLSMLSCDSSGSSGNSSPDWTGTWQVTTVTYPSTGDRDPSYNTYWSITEDTFTEATNQPAGCVSTFGDEIDTEDNVLTYTQSDGDGGTVKGRFEVSDGTLTVEVLEAENESFSKITATSIDPGDATCLDN